MISGIDHVAITVANLDAACDFYTHALGAVVEESYDVGGRIIVKRLAIGGALMNVHQQGNGVDLVAAAPCPGSTDICFRWIGDVEEARRLLADRGIMIIEGPVPRVAADGNIGSSIYFRDLDGNLVELLATAA